MSIEVTLITGASSGIGEAFARRLAAEGHNLLLVARSEQLLKSLSALLEEKFGISCFYLPIDLTKSDSIEKIRDFTSSKRLQITWLINNAGFGSLGYFHNLELERELEMIKLNIEALLALTHLFLPSMLDNKKGVILNVSSAAGFQPVPFMATYAATKAFVNSFTAAIAEEYRKSGVRIFALCPGSTKTNFFSNSGINRPVTYKGQQTAEQVVEFALKCINKRQYLAVSGLSNRLVAFAVRFLPTRLVTKVVAKIYRKRLK
ncbi:MAG TPA: SDR family oxidoreductase [Pyrinomonadaceae bacterium]|nr:SDR family oxidoreductase [Pyrinomonadaceae bacterium]